MKIKVTQKHINSGRRGHCYKCPVALAITAAIQVTNIAVYPSFVSFSADGYHDIDLPDELCAAVRHFDRTGEMKPFEFELDYENQSNPEPH